jgi:hypothetical protein
MTAVSPENEIAGNFLSQKLGMSQALDFHPSRKYRFVRLNPSSMSPRPSALSLLCIGTFHALHWTSFKIYVAPFRPSKSSKSCTHPSISVCALPALLHSTCLSNLPFQHLYTHHTSFSFLRPSMLRSSQTPFVFYQRPYDQFTRLCIYYWFIKVHISLSGIREGYK